MYKLINGKLVELTAEEINAMQEEQAKAEAIEKHRPLTESEVSRMLITAQINTLAVDDQTALRMLAFYPEWESGQAYTVGYKVRCKGKLYKVITAHTSQADWTPETAVTLFTRIDEQHDGSKHDPIPYEGNADLESGKYYIQNDVLYLCTRDLPKATHPLSELVGLYVEVVE